MAFDRDNFAKISSGYAHIVSPQMWSYLSLVDPISEFFSPGYFDEVNEESVLVNVGELFLMQGPVTATIGIVESINPIVIGPAIVTEALANASITLEKLDPGLDYGFRTIEAKSFPTIGGSPTETFTFAGVTLNGATAGDEFIIATMLQAPGLPTADARIRAAEIINDNSIQVEFAIDPSNTHIIQFVHLRRTDVIPI